MDRYTGFDISIAPDGEIKALAAAHRLDKLQPQERTLVAKRLHYAELWVLSVAASLFREHDWLKAFEFRIQMEFELDRSNHWAPHVSGNAYVTDYSRPSFDSARARIGAPLLHKEDVEMLYMRQFEHNICSIPKTWCRSLTRAEFRDLIDLRHLKASMLWDRLNAPAPAPTAKIIQFRGGQHEQKGR